MEIARTCALCLLFGGLALGTVTAAAAEEKAELKVGDKAPAFIAHDDEGKIFNSSDHVGKKIVVVYFFPAALTGG